MSGGYQPSDGESEVEEVPLTTAFRPPVPWTNFIQIPFQFPWGIKKSQHDLNHLKSLNPMGYVNIIDYVVTVLNTCSLKKMRLSTSIASWLHRLRALHHGLLQRHLPPSAAAASVRPAASTGQGILAATVATLNSFESDIFF